MPFIASASRNTRSTMVGEAVRVRDRWRHGEQRDIAIDMMHLTLNVVAQTLFATDLREEVDELADAINRIMGLYNFLVMLPAAEWLVHVRPPGPGRIRESAQAH